MGRRAVKKITFAIKAHVMTPSYIVKPQIIDF
jgi:hypothetical protein